MFPRGTLTENWRASLTTGDPVELEMRYLMWRNTKDRVADEVVLPPLEVDTCLAAWEYSRAL